MSRNITLSKYLFSIVTPGFFDVFFSLFWYAITFLLSPSQMFRFLRDALSHFPPTRTLFFQSYVPVVLLLSFSFPIQLTKEFHKTQGLLLKRTFFLRRSFSYFITWVPIYFFLFFFSPPKLFPCRNSGS